VCHGEKVPAAPDITSARKIISGGGPHVTMPVWGNILTPEQLDALVQYTFTASKGQGTQEGAQLFAANCSACHGQFGEGGPNPTRAGDMIPPISSAEFLGTRDDGTIRNIIAQGQPDLGMNPFSSANGGPLSDDQVDAIVAYVRAWQANPPQVAAPQAPTPAPAPPTVTAQEIYKTVCAQCHGSSGEGGIGPPLNTADFQAEFNDQAIFDRIGKGVPGTAMIGVGGVFSDGQINDLVALIRSLPAGPASAPATGTTPAEASFAGQVMPILEAKCQACHGPSIKLGGWDISSYDAIMTSGQNGPVIIPGDAEKSLLAQLIQGKGSQTMPPQGGMSSDEIQAILDWIAAGAKNN
jgi:cytochrome c oxidase cbb3-type subunit 3/ubiquinol-cytochrome c reductase cytochrome c subunit